MACRFLHHMEYKPMRFHYGMTNEPTINGWLGRCRVVGCVFTRKVLGTLDSRWTAPEPSSGCSPNPTEKAGVSATTDAPASFKGA